MAQLGNDLGQPIRIAWANQAYFYPTDLRKGRGYNLFVLCSASRRVPGAEASEGGYIQGAGDDSEGWSNGLTAPVFWENKDVLLATAESDLPSVIRELMERNGKSAVSQQATPVLPSTNLYIGPWNSNSGGYSSNFDLVISCNEKPADGSTGKILNLGCGSHKLGSRDLRLALDKVQAFAEKHLGSNALQSLLVTCETGKDLSVGALLAIVCLFYDDNGRSKATF